MKQYFLIQDQTANDNEDMFFVTDRNIEKQYSGYVVWKRGTKKELIELARQWNYERWNYEEE